MPFDEDIKFAEKLIEKNDSIKVADIGCGPNKFPGAVGVDIFERPGVVDVVHNLDEYPWPLEESSFDLVLCNHLIEHVNDFVVMVREIHRILKPGGYFISRTPHYSHVDSYIDPTHKRHMTTESFNYFLDDSNKSKLYTEPLFERDEIILTFGKGFMSKTGKFLANRSMRKYEKYYCRMFPANTLYYRLKAMK